MVPDWFGMGDDKDFGIARIRAKVQGGAHFFYDFNQSTHCITRGKTTVRELTKNVTEKKKRLTFQGIQPSRCRCPQQTQANKRDMKEKAM